MAAVLLVLAMLYGVQGKHHVVFVGGAADLALDWLVQLDWRGMVTPTAAFFS